MSCLRMFPLLALVLSVACGTASAQARRPHAAAPASPPVAQGPARFVTLADIQQHIRQTGQGAVIVHLWATWCPPCMEELPAIAQLARELPQQGVEVFSIAMDNATGKSAARVGRVIDQRADGALTRTIARFENVDAFIEGLDPHWEGSIPALLAYLPSGELVGALYGEASRSEIERFVHDLPTGKRHRLHALEARR